MQHGHDFYEYADDPTRMEMPCPCEKCGDWFDLNDGGAPGNSKVVICPTCYDRECEIIDLREQIEDIEYEMENGNIGKREGKRQIKELAAKILKLDS